MNFVRRLLPLVAVAVFFCAAAPAWSEDIIDQWASVQPPAPPKLQDVTVDPKTTALLMIDFLQQNCAPNPRCMAALPASEKLLAEARAAKAFVVYSKYPTAEPKQGEILAQVAPIDKEPVVIGLLDKFVDSDIDKILKRKGIKTVICVGNASNGAVLFTAQAAFAHKYQVIVAVDGVTSRDLYADQSVAHTLATAPVIGGKIVLTRSGMIKF
ncbi:MAG TPA: isochorismatase family protein [Stellaceae bacterium]|nr:isochorismatase family protein [Stellaceae bacterium]